MRKAEGEVSKPAFRLVDMANRPLTWPELHAANKAWHALPRNRIPAIKQQRADRLTAHVGLSGTDAGWNAMTPPF